MREEVREILEQLKIIVFVYIIVCFGQAITLRTPAKDMLVGSIISFVIVIFAVIIKNFVKKPNLPGFAWATLLAFVLTLPVSPVGGFIVEHVGKLNFMSHVTPLLAFAGISIGDQLNVLKKLGWKLILVSFIVMASTYFGSALISECVLKINGMI